MIAGVDEAGRGPWAGPVVAAAVILDPARPLAGLADSKALTAAARVARALDLRAGALAWGLGWASAAEIDALNIRRATHLAMRRAIEALGVVPALCLIDGNDAPALDVAARAIVRGDATEPAISAASILAKTARDAFMVEAAFAHPGYGFERHKGYGVPAHARALAELGPCALHRRSFAPVRAAIAARGRA